MAGSKGMNSIIAVQGLGSSYEWTWSVPLPSDNQSRYYWLKQSLPRDLPNARILAFEYDSKWFGNPDKVTLEECGARLLRCIVQDRTHRGETQMCQSRVRRNKSTQTGTDMLFRGNDLPYFWDTASAALS
jgi:hypothetical protein